MAEQQLLSQQNGKPNGCIIAAVTGTPNQPASNEISAKMKNCSNGDVNGTNLPNLKNGSTKIVADLNISETPSCEPPDGGARAWCVMLSAFFCNSIIFGIINTYGTVYIKLFQYLTETGDPEAASKACKFKCHSTFFSRNQHWWLFQFALTKEN